MAVLARICAVEESARPHIYQLMVRHFGNTNPTRAPHGTIEENGCGKFDDINDAALSSLKEFGITHIWLTGVLEQASSTEYPGRPADHSVLVKGQAGSPYAIRDYFDVCPDYATDPENRLDEFRALLLRMKEHGLKALIDFVPNHVARSYESDIHPDLSFGKDDDTSQFFQPNNNFFYLGDLHPGGGPPLKLPDGHGSVVFPFEREFGRVTGNNVISWSPSVHDWFETIKLNYGYNFTLGAPRSDTDTLPDSDAALEQTPDTWQKMDAILAYWQEMGVDGFRVDMAHMIPMAYWAWQTRRCRERDDHVFFMAEAYDSDPTKLTGDHVLDSLLAAGFDAVYDSPSYDAVKNIVEGPNWANDIDIAANPFAERFHHSLRYVENHDEVRIASKQNWGGLGMEIGRPASAILFGLGRGPIMIYGGQELGERADGSEGFSGDDGRSSIFDYGSLPTLVSWVNDHQYDGAGLTGAQRDLRAYYAQLLKVCAEPAFARGDFYGLNHANKENEQYGRIDGETVSGHWLYSFLRRDITSGQTFLVVVNMHPSESLQGVRIQIPENAMEWIGPTSGHQAKQMFADRLGSQLTFPADRHDLLNHGLAIPYISAKTALYLEWV